MTGRTSDLETLVDGLADLSGSQSRTGSIPITGVTCDSRDIQPGWLMVCIPGTQVDGHQFAVAAVERGAAALVVERHVPEVTQIPQAQVSDARLALARIADRFYGHPSGALDLVGVTGTDGKTTIANLIARVGERAGWSPGIIGTLGIRFQGEEEETVNTTPGPDQFQAALRSMVDEGVAVAVAEVSSHALDMARTVGAEFRVAILSNLTRDHLDWHGSLNSYREAKAKLFRRECWDLDPTLTATRPGVAVLPTEDEAARWIGSVTDLDTVWYGFDPSADWLISEPVLEPDRSRARLQSATGSFEIEIPLPGRFNLRNAAAAAAACRILGASTEAITAGLAQGGSIPGRMERIDLGQPFAVLVDYAHTPRALANVLAATREFTRGRIVCVVGCGGDRDRGKRPEMARVATDGAELVILTSDNPRSEDPERILDEMEAGLAGVATAWRRIVARDRAIMAAIKEALPEDTVIVAGKGHERFQEVGSRHVPCDDRELSTAALHALGFGTG